MSLLRSFSSMFITLPDNKTLTLLFFSCLHNFAHNSLELLNAHGVSILQI